MKENKYTIEEIIKEIFPNIYGNNKIKEAILMQYLSKKQYNILLIGDQEVGKTELINSVKRIQNKEKNLKSTIEISETEDFLIIDNLENLDLKEDFKQYIEKGKHILAVANPIFGRFNPYENISKQINLSPLILSKFDLIFIIRDIPCKQKDELISKKCFNDFIGINTEKIDDSVLDYLKEIKSKKVILSEIVKNKVSDFYVNLRNQEDLEDTEFKSIPITTRQLNQIFKLTESYSKFNGKSIAGNDEAEKAIDMLMYCLRKIGVDPKTRELDIDRLET